MSEAKTLDAEASELIQALLTRFDEELMVDEITPLKDRVLTKPMEKENVQKKGNLYVVESDENKTRRHLVLGVGSSAAESTGLQAGDTIIAGRYVGHGLEWHGENYRLISWQDILAALETSPERK